MSGKITEYITVKQKPGSLSENKLLAMQRKSRRGKGWPWQMSKQLSLFQTAKTPAHQNNTRTTVPKACFAHLPTAHITVKTILIKPVVHDLLG